MEKTSYRNEDSDILSYKIELQNRVMQNDVTLWVTNSKLFKEIFILDY